MKPRAFKFPVRAAACLALGLAGAGALLASAAESVSTPAVAVESSNASPAAPANVPKAGKKAKDPNAPPRVKTAKEIAFPLPLGETATQAKIPEHGLMGEILSQLNADSMTRIDNEHVQMHEVKLDLYHPDGKEDFHILLPTSVFNLKTHIITSDQPVTVKTQDFELTGERMEFNTVDRTGKLLGHVAMHVHNLKQVAAAPDATPVPQ